MIEVKNITKSFDGRTIIQDISFTFEKGKTNLIIGESGCGKTTLLKVMVGLHQPDSGQVLFEGKDFIQMSPQAKQEIRKELGMLFQAGALFDSLTLEENVQFPLDMFTNMSEEEKKERVNFVLKRVKLEGKNKLYPAELSGGMKKRAGLARAIAAFPKYLFCDEPNSGLDPKTAIVIDELIHELTKEFNMTTIVITHDMNSVIEIGENILFIHKGRAEWKGTKESVLNSGNEALDNFVFSSEFMRTVYKK
ncbi:MAG: phosphonate ABC transporter ATP-binding protein [Bacteroidia bacterium]|nr:MAG: phosphonate ABC transporter ATP-binding protein [Bacteroidia bacterium]